MTNPFNSNSLEVPPQTRVVKFALSWIAIVASVICLMLKELGLCYAFALLALATSNAPRTWRP